MTEEITAETVRGWIDDDLVGNVERIPDQSAEFNYTIEISNLLIHVVRKRSGGPLLIGQEIEYGEEIRSEIREMTESNRNELIARIRETLTAVPVVYGFHDERGANVRFRDMHRIFLEHRIYEGNITQHALMNGLVDVWKVMRYVDDIVGLISAVRE